LPGTIAIQRDICTGCDGDVFSVGEPQDVARITSPFTSMLCDCGDGNKFSVRPIEHHGQSAQIIYIAAQVGINVDFEHSLFDLYPFFILR
jgi:hypothetical protein